MEGENGDSDYFDLSKSLYIPITRSGVSMFAIICVSFHLWNEIKNVVWILMTTGSDPEHDFTHLEENMV